MLGAKATMAEMRKLTMDVADETGAAATSLATAPALTVGDASERRPKAVWKDIQTSRRGARWSPRATLAVSGGIALLLWGLVGLAVSAIR
jgi:Flp pilus assembly protein TadB